ncbi:hypothetical protein [Bremerella sp.]|uniref:hypothetical protein n=1 Tax=Bremerella sp. TaxID=2795602 RepID=UPI00391DD049
MFGRTLIAITALLLAVPDSSFAQAPDHWRVTVQDVALLPLAVSADGKLIAGRGQWAQHIFYLANKETSQVLFTTHLPEKTLAAAIAKRGDWVAVSTTDNVYRIDLQTGSVEPLLEGVFGAVAIDPAEEQLAVLGNLNVPMSAGRNAFRKTSKLGVYDLKLGQWIAQIDSPVAKDFVVTFDGDEVIGAGIGGNARSRKAQGFDCHIQLNLVNGETQTGYGPDKYDDRMSPPQADKEYQFPAAIQQATAAIAAALPRTHEGRGQFAASHVGFPGSVWALVADDQRIATVMDHGEAKRSVMTIPSSGSLSVRQAKAPGRVDVCRGRILYESAGHVTDVETGQEVVTLPQFKYQAGERNQWTRFVGPGWLVRDRDRLSYYVPGTKNAVWQRETPEGFDRPSPTFSPDLSRLAVSLRDAKDLFSVYSASDGTLVQRIPRLLESDAQNSASYMAFNRDGSKLLVQYSLYDGRSWNESLRLYDVATGEVTYERAIADKEHLNDMIPVGSGWVVGSYNSSLYIDQEGLTEKKLPFGQIKSAELIPGMPVPTFLVADDHDHGGVVTLDGQLLKTWQGREASVAFGGKVIARSTGISELELLDTKTLKPIASVQVIRLDQDFGWIVHTPDGYWDASPGFEKFVLVTHNGNVAQPAEMQSRHVPSLLQTRMPK